eukprot:759322-Hanusia_phi.AAC.2
MSHSRESPRACGRSGNSRIDSAARSRSSGHLPSTSPPPAELRRLARRAHGVARKSPVRHPAAAAPALTSNNVNNAQEGYKETRG